MIGYFGHFWLELVVFQFFINLKKSLIELILQDIMGFRRFRGVLEKNGEKYLARHLRIGKVETHEKSSQLGKK